MMFYAMWTSLVICGKWVLDNIYGVFLFLFLVNVFVLEEIMVVANFPMCEWLS